MAIDYSDYSAIIDYDFDACDMTMIKHAYRYYLKKGTRGIEDKKLCHELSNWLLQHMRSIKNFEKKMDNLFPVITKIEFHFPADYNLNKKVYEDGMNGINRKKKTASTIECMAMGGASNG